VKRSLAIVLALAACGGDKQEGGGDPAAHCAKIYEKRARLLNIQKDDATRAAFTEACVAQPPEYLRCETVDIVATRDSKCAAVLREHAKQQDLLNTILMTGEAPADDEPTAAGKPVERVAATTPPPPPPEPKVELVVPAPAPIPDAMPRYETVAEIPSDAIEVRATIENVPVTFAFKQDSVFQGVPCKAGTDTMVYKEGKRAGAVLAQDVELDGIALAAGTKVSFVSNGYFVSVETPFAQRIAGVPVAANTTANVRNGRVTMATLATGATILGHELPAGTLVQWDANADAETLSFATLGAAQTVGGTAFEAGTAIRFEADGKVVKHQ
jgi:hypothetical protein